MHILQQELDTVAHEWNTHRIRIGKNCLVPAGIPNELHYLPQVQGDMELHMYRLHFNHVYTYIQEQGIMLLL